MGDTLELGLSGGERGGAFTMDFAVVWVYKLKGGTMV